MAGIISGVQQSADFILSMLAGHSDELLGKCGQCIAGFLSRLDVQDRDDVLAKLLAHLNSDEDACICLLRCAPFDSCRVPDYSVMNRAAVHSVNATSVPWSRQCIATESPGFRIQFGGSLSMAN